MEKITELLVIRINQLGLGQFLTGEQRTRLVRRVQTLTGILFVISAVLFLQRLWLILLWIGLVLFTFGILEPVAQSIRSLQGIPLSWSVFVDRFREALFERPIYRRVTNFAVYIYTGLLLLFLFGFRRFLGVSDWLSIPVIFQFILLEVYVVASAQKDPRAALLKPYDAVWNILSGIQKALLNQSRVVSQTARSLAVSLAFAAISRDLWEFVVWMDEISFGVLLVCLVVVIISAHRGIPGLIDRELERYHADYELCSAQRLRRSLVSLADTFDLTKVAQLTPAHFREYEEWIAAKWRPLLLHKAIQGIAAAVKKPMMWQFSLEAVIFFVSVFPVAFCLSILLFPKNLLESWNIGAASLLFARQPGWFTAQVDAFNQGWVLAPGDPTLKYSLLIALVLTIQYILNASRDDEKVRDDLGLYLRQSLGDCLSLVAAYHASLEKGFQLVMELGLGFRLSPILLRKFSLADMRVVLPVLVVPDCTSRMSILAMLDRFPLPPSHIDREYACYFIVPQHVFYNSLLPTYSRIKFTAESLEARYAGNPSCECWVWMGVKHHKPGLNEFPGVEEAVRFLEERMANDILD
ncbi:MAG TPA: hypothetical protein VFY26_00890 [Anaerolineales bacterium]|nr:hypothetical protein [Anaerolineales bacterium]